MRWPAAPAAASTNCWRQGGRPSKRSTWGSPTASSSTPAAPSNWPHAASTAPASCARSSGVCAGWSKRRTAISRKYARTRRNKLAGASTLLRETFLDLRRSIRVPRELLAQLHHLADDHQARALHAGLLHLARQIVEGPRDYPLSRRSALLHQRRRPVRRQAMGDELPAQLRQRVQPHVDHHRLAAVRQLVPVQLQLAVLARVAGDEDAGLRVVAMGQRNAGIGGAAAGGG